MVRLSEFKRMWANFEIPNLFRPTEGKTSASKQAKEKFHGPGARDQV